MDSKYKFSNNWFEFVAKNIWDQLIPQLKPAKILEVGSYEGASICYLVDKLAENSSLEIHCIDSWEGGIENKPGGTAEAPMNIIESHFDHNMAVATSKFPGNVTLFKHKAYSDIALSKLMTDGKQNYFDLVYIDGSHQAPDVLCDAVLGFRLLRVGGLMIFDDYVWAEELPYGKDPIRCPKPAIDAFINLYFRKLKIIQAPLYQFYIQKISD